MFQVPSVQPLALLQLWTWLLPGTNQVQRFATWNQDHLGRSRMLLTSFPPLKAVCFFYTILADGSEDRKTGRPEGWKVSPPEAPWQRLSLKTWPGRTFQCWEAKDQLCVCQKLKDGNRNYLHIETQYLYVHMYIYIMCIYIYIQIMCMYMYVYIYMYIELCSCKRLQK